MPTASFTSARALDLLGCKLPIVLAGMGGVSRSDLVAAATAAGAFGFLGMVREPVALIRQEVAKLRQLGYDNFGVNIIPAATGHARLDQQIETIIELRVPAVALFWDLDVSVVRRFRDAGITVVYQVGSVEEAVAAEGAGAQIIVAQGVEAGGHVRGSTRLCQLLPEVLKAVHVPVLAAGGLATGDDLVAARALGADGVVVGTVLAAAEESFAHPYHKQRLVLGTAHETVLTRAFHINWPDGAVVRVLENPVTRNMHDPERPEVRHVIGEEEGRPIYLFSTDSPLQSMTGDFESMALYAGTGIDCIVSIRPAGEIIREIAAVADVAPIGLDAPAVSVPEMASPVCYVGEMTGTYLGQLETSEIAVEMTPLVADLRAVLLIAQDADPAPAKASSPAFSPRTKSLARWIAGLDAAWGPISSQGQLASSGYAKDRAVERLRSIIPRLPESVFRSELAELRGWLEGTNT